MKRRFDPDRILRELRSSGREPGRFDIRIDSRGCWYHEGGLIGRIELVRLFSTVLRIDEDGGYWLVTPVEQGRIEVEDVPFVWVELRRGERDGAPLFELRNNLDEWVSVDADRPLRLRELAGGGGTAPYVEWRDGLFGRVDRPVYYELAELALEHDGVFGIFSGGIFHRLGDP
ncbi:MAG: DUF1285 domain-containing protein [Geminicoccaceae bacterium]|nr:DUF1285 domain-containing protein [Geminicoccaceae bacterium]